MQNLSIQSVVKPDERRFIRTLHEAGYELEPIDCVQNNYLRFAKTVNHNKTIYDMEPCFSTPIEDALHMIETA